MSNNVAKAELTIGAPVEEVWKALTTPEMIKKYMFGATVISDWKEGSSITWTGEWNGKPYEDRGKILVIDPLHELKYSHFSPKVGQDDQLGCVHIVDVLLSRLETGTFITVTQENNSSEEERLQSEKNWTAMLVGLKEFLEAGSVPYPKKTPEMKLSK
jgi:uncharacterized protein YndB with AHSA1/START domain